MKKLSNFKDLLENRFTSGGSRDKTDSVFSYMNDDEKHIENIKQTLIITEKKVSGTLISPDSDKKQRKYPGFVIGTAFEEVFKNFDASHRMDSVLPQVLLPFSKFCIESGTKQADYERKVEAVFLDSIRRYTTDTLPRLGKCQEKVKKDHSQLKSVKSKYEASLKALNNSSTGPSSIAENRTENLKSELEDCELKHKQSRDQYEAEMLLFAREELNIALLYRDYLDVQKAHFKEMHEKIEDILPGINKLISSSVQRPVFGVPLSEHLSVSERKISLVFEFGIGTLMSAMDEEGLFRLSGSSSKLKALRNALDAQRQLEVMHAHGLKYEHHVVAGVIKAYLRELPEPLTTSDLADEWIRVADLPESERLPEMWQLMNKMPEEAKANLCFLIKFFKELTKNHLVNKMSSQNIAIAIGPSLFWDRDETKNMKMTNSAPIIVETLITRCDYFFPEGKYPSLYYEEFKKNLPLESPSETDSCPRSPSHLNSIQEHNDFFLKEFPNTPTRPGISSKVSSFRSKQNKSPIKDPSLPSAPNLSPTATIRSTAHASPRMARPKSFMERPQVTPPSVPGTLVPHRPAPEVVTPRENFYRGSLHISSNSSMDSFGVDKPVTSIYPSLDSEPGDIVPQTTMSTFLKSVADWNSSDLSSLPPPQKPPRSNATAANPPVQNTQNQNSLQGSPVPDSTHL